MPKKKKNEVKKDVKKNEPVSEKKGGGPDNTDNGFPVVGIGASAGGLEAIETFLSGLPLDSGICFVIISHTDPSKATMLPDILAKKTKVPVLLIEEGMKPEPGKIYLPPSDMDPEIKNNAFHLKKRTKTSSLHMPIDMFLRSLAEERVQLAGGIILSGTGTDGTHGLKAIKEKAGVTAAQKPDSARHAGMPRSAIESGMVDFILEPNEMPERLSDYFEHAARIETEDDPDDYPPRELQKILTFVATRTSHDFSLYKKSTLIRRIERRMNVTGSKNGTEYVKYLYRNPEEAEILIQDMLIGVTSFFRDPEAFAYLREEVLPGMVEQKNQEKPLRVWVAGCSTGEEAYSVAIILKEALEDARSRRGLQIFATDLDERAIEKARRGTYIKNIASDVSPERLEKFFIEEKNSYRVKSDVRESIIFAVQNLLSDPPYSGIDLLVCRNLLIYLEARAQRKLFPLFHYVLNKKGVMFLGSSESIGRFGDLFESVKKKFNIYSKKEVNEGMRPAVEFPTGSVRVEGEYSGARQDSGYDSSEGITRETEKILLRQFTPPCVIVDRDGQILHIHGKTGRYLEDPEGKPTTRIVDKAREGIRFALSSSIRKAASSEKEVREEGLRVKENGGFRTVNLLVRPYPETIGIKNALMIIFEDLGEAAKGSSSEPKSLPDEQDSRVLELEQELNRVRHEYQGSLEELQSSNEELRSANEEARSSNEELQSTNEELESSREELQSLNEELSTVNNELNAKTEELSKAYDSIANVLESTQIAILFLSEELLVKSFTKEAARLFNLIDSDVGRPIGHISHNLDYDDLEEKIQGVIKTLHTFEDKVKTDDGSWYRMRIMIFRESENTIDGIVATFINIDAETDAMEELSRSESRFRALVDSSSEVLYRMSPDWKEMRQLHSRGFLTETEVPDRNWMEKYIPPDEQKKLQDRIDEAIKTRTLFELKHRVYREDRSIGLTLSRAVPILDEDGEIKEWFGSAVDVTER